MHAFQTSANWQPLAVWDSDQASVPIIVVLLVLPGLCNSYLSPSVVSYVIDHSCDCRLLLTALETEQDCPPRRPECGEDQFNHKVRAALYCWVLRPVLRTSCGIQTATMTY